jgi:hypothetical protein
MPSADMEALIDTIPDAKPVGGSFALPCNATTEISLNISGQNFVIPPHNFISDITSPVFEGFCFTRFASQNATHWDLGSPFTSAFPSDNPSRSC